MGRKGGSSRARAAPPSVVPTVYPGKKDDGTGMDETLWGACREMLDNVYKAKDGSRRMADIFRELPDKNEWADYYEAIPEPECLDNIASRLGANGFGTPEEFFKQLHLVCLNAMHYNEENSTVWNDAKKYEEQIHEAWRARAADGTFAFADPYHKGSRGRKRADIKAGRASTTPAPAPAPAGSASAATPPVTIHLRVPRPETTPATPAAAKPEPAAAATTSTATPAPAAAAAPAPAPAPTPAPKTRETRSRAAPVSPAASTRTTRSKATPPPKPAPQPASNSRLSPTDTALVAAADAKLARWEGPLAELPGDPAPGGVPGSGWWGEGAPEFERTIGGPASWKRRIRSVVEALAGYKAPTLLVLAEAFDKIPENADIPFLSSPTSPSWGTILQSAREGKYANLRDFDMDMARLFERARRWFAATAVEYGHVVTLQRLYNALTAPYPMSLPPNGVPAPNTTRFASIPVGPGKARSVQDMQEALRAGATQEQVGYGMTAFLDSRLSAKDRMFTEEARHKGVAYRVGDFVQLINPDDASRPIVGQIFKTFVPTKGYATHHVTVCWYFRPEQTIHPADQVFTEREVFKTAHFCDHPVEDIIERVAVQPTQSAVRGRPKPPAFYPGWPLYVCSQRYLDKPCLFMRIRKWSNVVPESVRHTDPGSVVTYDRTITLPTAKSPFTLGAKGPGAVGRPKRQPMPADDEEEEAAAATAAPPPSRRPSEPSRAPERRPQQTPQAQPQRQPHPASTPAGPSRTQYDQQQQQRQAKQQQQQTQPRTPATQWQRPQQTQVAYSTRTFANVVGGAQVLEQVAVREYLPQDTARLFEQDARHQVLWFSAPPLPIGAVRLPTPPRHSLEYLVYLSKRKAGASAQSARPAKRFRTSTPTDDDEDAEGEADAEGEDDGEAEAEAVYDDQGDLGRHWWAKGQSEEDVLAGLRAVVQ